MKNHVKIFAWIMVVTMALFMISCESDEETTTDPLVGTWELTSASQVVSYTLADSAYGMPAGTVLQPDTTLNLINKGVEATVEIYEDGTFIADGNFPHPVQSDTLGAAIRLTGLISDEGTWSQTEQNGIDILTVTGEFVNLGGAMTLENDVLNLQYSSVDTSSYWYYSATATQFIPLNLEFASSTELEFNKQ